MSTLRVNNIGENSGLTQETLAGMAKALFQYQGVSNTVIASLNVSSITDSGTGVMTANWTNAFAAASEYSALLTINGASTESGQGGTAAAISRNLTTTDAVFRGANTGAVDSWWNSATAFGDLA